MKETVIKLLEKTKYDAHKGNSWKYPENSYNAICSSLFNRGLDAVEFDVRMTKDGKLVIRHDDSMITTSNSFKKVSEMTLDELKALNVRAHKIDYFIHLFQVMQDRDEEHGKHELESLKELISKKDKIITLEELLELAPSDKKLLLEVKGSDEYYKTDKYSKGILELVNEYKDKNVCIHGADVKSMWWFKENVKNTKVGIGVGKDISVLDLPLDHACFNLSRMPEQIDKIVSALEKRPDRDFHFWKVDTKKELELYKMFLQAMAKHGLTSSTSIMTNDVKAAKMLIKNNIDDLKKIR